MEFKPIHRYTRAGKWGKLIKCPECNEQAMVYHFNFSSLGCQYCKAKINKEKWLVETK